MFNQTLLASALRAETGKCNSSERDEGFHTIIKVRPLHSSFILQKDHSKISHDSLFPKILSLHQTHTFACLRANTDTDTHRGMMSISRQNDTRV